MRATIPLVFVLMIMSTKYMIDHAHLLKEKKISYVKITCVILMIFLILGAFTPLKEFERGFEQIIANGKINLVFDDVFTFKKFFPGGVGFRDKNFIAVDYEHTLFFRHITK